jgi:hypothetical protein
LLAQSLILCPAVIIRVQQKKKSGCGKISDLKLQTWAAACSTLVPPIHKHSFHGDWVTRPAFKTQYGKGNDFSLSSSLLSVASSNEDKDLSPL